MIMSEYQERLYRRFNCIPGMPVEQEAALLCDHDRIEFQWIGEESPSQLTLEAMVKASLVANKLGLEHKFSTVGEECSIEGNNTPFFRVLIPSAQKVN